MSENLYAIGIDLGGTHIKGVVSDAQGNILLQQHHDTGDGAEDPQGLRWKRAVRETVHSLRREFRGEIHAAGMAAPGLANDSNTAIACLPGRLQGLEGFVWGEYVGEAHFPVINDAQAALIAESRFGAAKGFRHVAMITLGTGVGGGLLIDGRLHQGFLQRAGHLGHLSVNARSEYLGITSMPGNLEDAIGNSTVARRTFGRFQDTAALVRAYEKGDTFATYAWLQSVQQLAVALAAIGNVLSPELIVTGGGITKAGNALFGPLADFMDIFEWRPGGQRMEIRKAAFSDFAGAIGAAAYVMGETEVGRRSDGRRSDGRPLR